jgi:hypothetical protein
VANSSPILVAQDEPRHSKGSTRLRHCRVANTASHQATTRKKKKKRRKERTKELAMRMERLPSSLVGHTKKVAPLDTTLAEMDGDLLVSNPLERNLGLQDFGRYTKAPGDVDFAFKKLNGRWDEEIQDNDDSDEESSDDSESDPDTINETK